MKATASPSRSYRGLVRDDLASLAPALLQASPLVTTVELCGSRASGTAGRYSDRGFCVSTEDFATLASELSGLVRALEPLVEQWDRLSDEACYMLVVRGPTKIDVIFPAVPHEHEPPWVIDAATLSAIDDHFWDWVLFLTSKVDAGNDSLVEAQLATMRDHILVPMGITAPTTSLHDAVEQYVAARNRCTQRFGVAPGRRAEFEVVPIVDAVSRR